MVNTIHLNTLLGIMIMMLLSHYIQRFHKQLAILIGLMKIKTRIKIKIKTQQQCLLKLKRKNFLKITIRYGKN